MFLRLHAYHWSRKHGTATNVIHVDPNHIILMEEEKQYGIETGDFLHPSTVEATVLHLTSGARYAVIETPEQIAPHRIDRTPKE